HRRIGCPVAADRRPASAACARCPGHVSCRDHRPAAGRAYRRWHVHLGPDPDVDRSSNPCGNPRMSSLAQPETSFVSAAEDRIAAATQLELTWWRFRKHRLAVASGIVVILFYLIVIFADFLAVTPPHATDAARSYIPPQAIHWFDQDGSFRPHVYALKGRRDLRTFKLHYAPDPTDRPYLVWFAEGYPYFLFGIFETKAHIIGLDRGLPEDALFLLGTDQLGRDVWSRLMLATRTSLTIGLVGVGLSLFLG